MFKNIVVSLDLTDQKSMELVFPHALHFANSFGSKLHLAYIMPDFGIKTLEDYLPRNWKRDQREKYKSLISDMIEKFIPTDVNVESHIGRGAVYDGIINYSEEIEADLIILSAVRPQLKNYMLGPNASKIVRHSSISVMVVRD